MKSLLSRLMVFVGIIMTLAITVPTEAAVVSGTYTGDGVDNRAINAGFQPELLLVQRQDSNGLVMQVCMTGMSSGRDLGVNATVNANGIKSLTATGFTVGNSTVNTEGVVY